MTELKGIPFDIVIKKSSMFYLIRRVIFQLRILYPRELNALYATKACLRIYVGRWDVLIVIENSISYSCETDCVNEIFG